MSDNEEHEAPSAEEIIQKFKELMGTGGHAVQGNAELYGVEATNRVPSVFVLDRVTFGPIYGLEEAMDPEERSEGRLSLAMGVFGTSFADDQGNNSEVQVNAAIENPTETLLTLIGNALGPLVTRDHVKMIMQMIISCVHETNGGDELPALLRGLVEEGMIPDPRRQS